MQGVRTYLPNLVVPRERGSAALCTTVSGVSSGAGVGTTTLLSVSGPGVMHRFAMVGNNGAALITQLLVNIDGQGDVPWPAATSAMGFSLFGNDGRGAVAVLAGDYACPNDVVECNLAWRSSLVIKCVVTAASAGTFYFYYYPLVDYPLYQNHLPQDWSSLVYRRFAKNTPFGAGISNAALGAGTTNIINAVGRGYATAIMVEVLVGGAASDVSLNVTLDGQGMGGGVIGYSAVPAGVRVVGVIPEADFLSSYQVSITLTNTCGVIAGCWYFLM